MNYKKRLVKFDISKIMNMSFLLFLVPAILGVIVNLVIKGKDQSITGTFLYDAIFSAGLLIVLLFVHEGLHALGFILFGKAKLKNIKFGVIWKQGMLYCTTTQPLTVKAYAISLVLPLIIAGLVPFIIIIFLGNALLVLVFAFMISGASGDILMLNKVCSYPKDQLILDHPSAPAFYLIYPEGKEPADFTETTEEEEKALLEEMKENPLKSKVNKSWALKTIYVLLFIAAALLVMFGIGVVLSYTI